MKTIILLPLSTLIVTLASIPIVTEAQVDQPSNITRTEGQTNVIIPCPPSFVAGNVIPFWKINETFYHHSRLPCPFIASAGGALIITVVDSTLNGTSFQCFAPPGSRDASMIARQSDVGVLTVTPDPSHTSSCESMLELQLQLQQLQFTSRDAFLSWNIVEMDTIAENINNGRLRYYIYNSTRSCDLVHGFTAADTPDTSTVLSLEGRQDAYFNITAFDENGEQYSTINEIFRIKSGVVTKKIPRLVLGSTCQECVNVPQPEKAPFFNLPLPTGRDILCTAVRVENDVNSCINLHSSCGGFTDTIFSTSITICSTNSSSNDYKMCFSNITAEMNGTRIHFFYSERTLCSTGINVISRLYVDSYEIVVQAPTIDVTTNMTTGELCLVSQPVDCFATTRYNITVYDVAGCSVYTQTDIVDGVCTQVEVLQNSDDVCASMEIAIDAFNPLVTYHTVYYTVGEEISNYLCDCARTKAQVYLYETSPSGTKFSCNTDAGCHIMRFSVVVMDRDTNSKVFTSELQSCAAAASHTVQITNLTCNRWYSVSAFFAFSNGSLTTCLLSNTTSVYSGDCPTTVTDEATTIAIIDPTITPFLALLAIPITLLLTLTIILVITVCSVPVLRKRKQYSPKLAESQHGEQMQMKDAETEKLKLEQ